MASVHLRSGEVTIEQPVMKDILLRGSNGEQDMMGNLSFLTQKDMYTKNRIWLSGSKDYSINPFGKLTKKPARHLPNGQVFRHKSYYHGFFISLLCTEDFYAKHSEGLKDYDVTDEKHYDRTHMPKWF